MFCVNPDPLECRSVNRANSRAVDWNITGLHPELGWYVGFSGVLFGLYVLAAVASLSRQFFMSTILIGFIGLKIGLEQWSSVKITSSELIGVPVLVDAHLYGVLMAVLIILIQLMWKYFRKQS